MAKVKCAACGKTEAHIHKKKDLEKAFRAPVGTVGLLQPSEIIAVGRLVLDVAKMAIDFVKERDSLYIVCASCGHYQKM